VAASARSRYRGGAFGSTTRRNTMVLRYERPDDATDDLDWNDQFEGVTIGSQVSLIFVYSSRDGAGPRLHQHPYTETFVVRHGRALFTVADERIEAVGGQVLVVPALTPHKFAVIGGEPFVSTNIHANPTFETEWLEERRRHDHPRRRRGAGITARMSG
jgi:mannose-6-phosphate isomerase-like protein (cupin superfamily)